MFPCICCFVLNDQVIIYNALYTRKNNNKVFVQSKLAEILLFCNIQSFLFCVIILDRTLSFKVILN